MAKRREPKYRLLAYDGDRKSRDLLPSHSDGHRIQASYDKKEDVLERAQTWMASHPPQHQYGMPQQPHVVITDKRGDDQAMWEARDEAWFERFNHLRKRARNSTGALADRLKNAF
jgi:hypothetical protein